MVKSHLARDSRTQPSIRFALALGLLSIAGSARADTLADAAADATVAVQAVEPTGDGRARVAQCSGALIAPDLVLTAGHCLDGATGPERVAVFAYRGGRPIPTPLRVAAVARHPDHVAGWASTPGDPETRAREIASDLALIRLAKPVDGARPIAIFALPPAAGAAAGVGASVAGGPAGSMKRIRLSGVRGSTGDAARVAFATASDTVCGGDSGGPAVTRRPDGAAALWGVIAAVLKPRGGCGGRLAITPVDPAAEPFLRMQAELGLR